MICVKCKLEIDEKRDSFLVKNFYKKGKIFKTEEYHIECWNLHFNQCIMQKVQQYSAMASTALQRGLKNLNVEVIKNG